MMLMMMMMTIQDDDDDDVPIVTLKDSKNLSTSYKIYDSTLIK